MSQIVNKIVFLSRADFKDMDEGIRYKDIGKLFGCRIRKRTRLVPITKVD